MRIKAVTNASLRSSLCLRALSIVMSKVSDSSNDFHSRNDSATAVSLSSAVD